MRRSPRKLRAMNVSDGRPEDGGAGEASPRPNDSRLTGLDVFPRPASPGLQLLPWRESSLDGLGATGKVSGQRNLGRGFVGSGLVSPFWLLPQFPYPSPALSWISTPSPTLFSFPLSSALRSFSPFLPFALTSLVLSSTPLSFVPLSLLPSHLSPFYLPSFPLSPPGQFHQRHSAPQLQGLPSGQRQAF